MEKPTNQPTHMIDMLKLTRTLPRTTWLSLTRGGAQTSIAGTIVTDGPPSDEQYLVHVIEGESFVLFAAPKDACTPIKAKPADKRPPQPAEHAPLPQKTPRAPADPDAAPND